MSANEFAGWILAEHRYPPKPAATLELLVDGAVTPPTAGSSDIEVFPAAPTIDNILAAVRRWNDRVAEHPDNRAVFFFSGHGIGRKDDIALLASDFGADTHQPMNGALSYGYLKAGMNANPAADQIYFVDACRTADAALFPTSGPAGASALRVGTRPVGAGPVRLAEYYATVVDQTAWGRTGAASLYTTALLKGLRGGGSDNPDGDWCVMTMRLAEAVDYYLSVADTPLDGTFQQPDFRLANLVLTCLPHTPVVPITVRCEKDEHFADTNFQLTRYRTTDSISRSSRDTQEDVRYWDLQVEAGFYELAGEHDGRTLEIQDVDVRPHRRTFTLKTGT